MKGHVSEGQLVRSSEPPWRVPTKARELVGAGRMIGYDTVPLMIMFDAAVIVGLARSWSAGAVAGVAAGLVMAGWATARGGVGAVPSWVQRVRAKWWAGVFLGDWTRNMQRLGLVWKTKTKREATLKLHGFRVTRADLWEWLVRFPPTVARRQIPELVGRIPDALAGAHAAQFEPVDDHRSGAGLIRVSVSFRPFPTKVDYDRQVADRLWGSNRVWLGIDSIGEDVILDLDAEPVLIVSGRTGSGKSAAVLSIGLQIVNKQRAWGPGHPRAPKMAIVSPKMDAKFEPLARLGVTVVTTIPQAVELLSSTAASLERRAVDAAVHHEDLSTVGIGVIYIDEPMSIFGSDQVSARTMHEVEEIARKGRSLGVRLIVGPQTPSVEACGGSEVFNNASLLALGDIGTMHRSIFGSDPDAGRYLVGIEGRGVLTARVVAPTVDGDGGPDLLPADVRGIQVGWVDYRSLDELLVPEEMIGCLSSSTGTGPGAPVAGGPTSGSILSPATRELALTRAKGATSTATTRSTGR